MKLNIGKYAFNSKEQFDSKVENLYTINEEGDKIPNSKFAIITDGLGFIEVTAPTFDEDGEELTPSIMGTDYHCDIVWYDLEDHPYGWKSYSIDIDTEGLHAFAGISYQDNKFQ